MIGPTDFQIILGKVRPLSRPHPEAHPQVLIIAPVTLIGPTATQTLMLTKEAGIKGKRRGAAVLAGTLLNLGAIALLYRENPTLERASQSA